MRDFFFFLISKANSFVTIPGTFEVYLLGDAWLSKAQDARDISLEACAWEHADIDILAGQEWQKIFGSRIPMQAI